VVGDNLRHALPATTAVPGALQPLFRLGGAWVGPSQRVALIILLLKFSEKISQPAGQRSLNGVLRSEVLPYCVGDTALPAKPTCAKPDRWRFLE